MYKKYFLNFVSKLVTIMFLFSIVPTSVLAEDNANNGDTEKSSNVQLSLTCNNLITKSGNNVAKTLDTVKYRFEYSINSENEAISKDTVLKVEIPSDANVNWESRYEIEDANGADVEGSKDITVSHDGKTLTYELGEVPSGTSHYIEFVAKVLGSAPNGERFAVNATLSSENGESKTVTSQECVVSATPKYDLEKQSLECKPNVQFENKNGMVLTYGILISKDGDEGNEAVGEPITFKDILSNFGIKDAKLYDFGINGEKETIALLPYGKLGIGNDERSVVNSGQIEATQENPGGDVDITITGIESNVEHYPSFTSNNTPIEKDRKYVFSGYLKLWVSDEDVKVGQSTVNNEFSEMNLVSITGQKNFENGTEPMENNKVSYEITKAEEGYPGAGFDLKFVDSALDNGWLSTETNFRSGDGTVVKGENLGITTRGMNIGTKDLKDFNLLTKIDNNALEVEPVEIKDDDDNVIGTEDCVLDTYDVSKDKFEIKYGVGNYSTKTQMHDDIDNAEWYNSLEEAKKHGDVIKVMVSLKKGEIMPKGSSITLRLNVKVKNIKTGKLAVARAALKASEFNKEWMLDDYNYVEAKGYKGDRAKVVDGLVRIESEVNPKSIRPMENATVTLSPSFTTNRKSTKEDIAHNITIKSTLPKELNYVANSAVQGDKYFEPKIEENKDGTTTLIWTLSNYRVNQNIIPIKYDIRSALKATGKDKLEIKTVIESPADVTVESKRTSYVSVNIINEGGFGVIKEVNTPLINPNENLEYTLKYYQNSNSIYKNVKIIDVLPFNGDNRNVPSKFNGSYVLDNIEYKNNEKVYVTKDKIKELDFEKVLNNCKWEEYKKGKALKGVTAIKIEVSQLPNEEKARNIKINLKTKNNKAGDLYSNNCMATVNEINKIVQSPDVLTKVIEEVQIGQVSVKYLDIDTNEELLESEIKSGNVGDEYETLKREIPEYNFVEVKGEVKGKFEKAQKEVIYFYKKNKPVVKPNVDQKDDKNEDPKEDKKDKEQGTLMVKHLDIDTEEKLLEPEIKSGNVGDEYETLKREIPEYNFVEIKGEPKGKFEKGQKEVIYLYRKNKPVVKPTTDEGKKDDQNEDPKENKKYGTLIVKYVNIDTNTDIESEINKMEEVGNEYTTSKKHIPGYDFVKVDGEEKGKYIEGDIIVTYYYKKKAVSSPSYGSSGSSSVKYGNITVRYLEDGTNKEIAPTEIKSEKIGQNYKISPKNIDGYEYVKVEGKESGTYTRKTSNITYYYKKKILSSKSEEVYGQVVIKYVEENTEKELIPKEVLEGKIGESYDVSSRNIKGYEYVRVEGKEKGNYTKNKENVTYYYKKKILSSQNQDKYGKVIVKYIDDNTGKEILPKDVLEGKINTSYDISKRDIKGYEYVKVEGKENGQYKEKDTEVNYYYKKNAVKSLVGKNSKDISGSKTNIINKVNTKNSNVDPNEKPINKNNDIPNTGTKNFDLLLIGLAMFTLSGFCIIKRKLKSKNN